MKTNPMVMRKTLKFVFFLIISFPFVIDSIGRKYAPEEGTFDRRKRIVIQPLCRLVKETIVPGDVVCEYESQKKGEKNKANIFNTYAREGLPPGPIGAVGEHALRAVLRPAESEFLFFVALGDGTGGHAFSRTFEEHRRNVDNYRKARKSQR